jgi:hypothetical protein
LKVSKDLQACLKVSKGLQARLKVSRDLQACLKISGNLKARLKVSKDLQNPRSAFIPSPSSEILIEKLAFTDLVTKLTVSNESYVQKYQRRASNNQKKKEQIQKCYVTICDHKNVF